MNRTVMSRTCRAGLVPFLLCSLAAADPPASQPAETSKPVIGSLFDPARHMHVSEVKAGMKGYGLSVFKGTKIERFEVEVISVLKNFNPKADVILIKFHGDNLEHDLAIAGMSGSPIFLYDDTGKARMIGAFAYAWPLPKDPIAGVQPIEYMLQLPEVHQPPASEPSGGSIDSSRVPMSHPPAARERAVLPTHWSLSDSVLLPGMKSPPRGYPVSEFLTLKPSPGVLAAGSEGSQLIPLATPLMVGGLSPRMLDQLQPMFRAYGFMAMQAGGGGGGDSGQGPGESPARIEPGCVLGVPMVEGDVNMSAIGTCTEVIGKHVVAFGHSFNSEGHVSLPLAGGSIQGIVANLSSSFKLGSLTDSIGTLQNDQTVGISGELGAAPSMVPIDLRIKYTDGSEDQLYHFTAAVHPKLTPMLVSLAMGAAITGAKDLPADHTVDYDLLLEFANGKTIHVVNSDVNLAASDLFFAVGTPLIAASDNPFSCVMVKKITGTMVVSAEVRESGIQYASVPRSKYRPGETVTAYVTTRAYHAGDSVLAVSMELPKDLPDGTYQLTISDWQKYLNDERTAEPFKFTAETIDQMFDVLQEASAIRHDALYLRLLRQADGVSVGHTAMPRLPSSRRQILLGAGRSDTTLYVSSSVKVVPTDCVMSGSADFQITIDKNLVR